MLNNQSIDFQKIIFDKYVSANLYQPVVLDNRSIPLFTVNPSKNNKFLYENQNVDEKNIYLYELRTLLDAFHLIENRSNMDFLLEIRMSISTLSNGLFLKSILKNNYNKFINQRIILNIYESFSSTAIKDSVCKKLKELNLLGFRTMMTTNINYISFDSLCFFSNFIKVDLTLCPYDLRKSFFDLFLNLNSESNIIFSGLNSKCDAEYAINNGGKLFQGDYFGKETSSLISSRYLIY